jgi:hypothetical protein
MDSSASINSIPAEILNEILHYLPPSEGKTARLASRRFNLVLAKKTFSVLISFLDPDVATTTLQDLASDLSRRPMSIWSPHCSIPQDLPLQQNFLRAAYAGLSGSPWRPEVDNESASKIDADSFSSRLGRQDITEGVLRDAMFRYALYLSYTHKRIGKSAQLRIHNNKLWLGEAEST